ncbi:MAG: polyphosphate polymerase domain-containing protein [Balneolales bacterium]
MSNKYQKQRFEHKYVVHEHVALAIRDFVKSYLILDQFGAKQPGYSYPVHSLYLDSPDLILYKNTINGDKNRFKLRLRYYEKSEDSAVFFEIKRRINNIIQKKRATVPRHLVPLIISGYYPDSTDLVDFTPQNMEALDSFLTLLNQLQAVPQVHVSYLREAWMAEGSNTVRVTMDRMVKTEPHKQLSLSKYMENPTHVFKGKVVLELKFTDKYPYWFKDLVQVFGLRQGSAAKYVDGVYNMGERGLISAYI